MIYVRKLRTIINANTGVPMGDKWIKKWLLHNLGNANTMIPTDAPFSLITGLRILFEYPFQAVCDVVSDNTDATLVPYVAIKDRAPTDILILEITSKKVIASFQKHAWKFRWRTLRDLEDWMKKTADTMRKRLKETA